MNKRIGQEEEVKLGKKIRQSRKKKRVTQEQLGKMVGLSQNALSQVENGEIKNGPNPRTLVRIAEALKDSSIVIAHCEECPVRKHLEAHLFADAENQSSSPADVVAKLRRELSSSLESLKLLFFETPAGEKRTESEKNEIEEQSVLEQIADLEQELTQLKFLALLASTQLPKEPISMTSASSGSYSVL